MDSEHDQSQQWATYDANVQAYRGLGMSVQSILLAVGAILLDSDAKMPFGVLALVALTVTWFVFFPVIFARTAIVDFHKFALDARFDRQGRRTPQPVADHLREKEYAEVTLGGQRLRRSVYRGMDELSRETYGASARPFRTLRQTRVKLDVVLPGLLTAVWLVFAAQVYLG